MKWSASLKAFAAGGSEVRTRLFKQTLVKPPASPAMHCNEAKHLQDC